MVHWELGVFQMVISLVVLPSMVRHLFSINGPHTQGCVLPFGFTCPSVSPCLSSQKSGLSLLLKCYPPSVGVCNLAVLNQAVLSFHLTLHHGLRLVAFRHITGVEEASPWTISSVCKQLPQIPPTRSHRISEMEVRFPPIQNRAALWRLPDMGHLASSLNILDESVEHLTSPLRPFAE